MEQQQLQENQAQEFDIDQVAKEWIQNHVDAEVV